jgi:uncharacterized membrane protein
MNPSSSRTAAPKDWLWLLSCFFIVGLGVVVAIKQAPFYIPDEGAHYLRTYEVGHLHLLNLRGSVGTDMPCNDYAVVAGKYHPVAWANVKTEAEQNDRNCVVNTRNTAGAYSFVPYIPAAFAMRIAERMGGTVEQRLIASRATGFLVWITLIFVALRGICDGRTLMGCVVLVPSFFWQLVGVSADGAILASSLVYVLIVLKALQGAPLLTRGMLVQLLLTAALMGASKGVYAPLCLFSWALWGHLPARGVVYKIALLSLPTLVCLGVFAFFMGLADPSLVFLGNGANPALQMEHVVNHPWQFVETVYRSLCETMNVGFIAPSYAVPNGDRGYGITVFTLVSSGSLMVFTSFGVSKTARCIAALIALVLCLAVCLPLYLTYNPVAWPVMLGLQSRYFLPIIPLVFMAVSFDATKIDWGSLRKYAMWAPLLPVIGLYLACINIP